MKTILVQQPESCKISRSCISDVLYLPFKLNLQSEYPRWEGQYTLSMDVKDWHLMDLK